MARSLKQSTRLSEWPLFFTCSAWLLSGCAHPNSDGGDAPVFLPLPPPVVRAPAVPALAVSAPVSRPSRGAPPLVVYLDGQFMNPGAYPWTNGMTLQDGFSVAGGFTESAGNMIRLIHWDGSTERFPRNSVGPPTNNPVLKPGDQVWNPSVN